MAANFDPLARSYRWLEYLSFGPWLACCRNTQLTHLEAQGTLSVGSLETSNEESDGENSAHALVLGDGDGRFLASLLLVNLTLTADVVDSSRRMLDILDRRIRLLGPQAHQRIRLHHADALSWNMTGCYDLIVTHFFLDCFFPEELERLFDRVLAHASPNAQWVISEFAIPQSALAKPIAGTIVSFLYRAFGWLTGLKVRALPDYATVLRRLGLVLSQERQYLAGLLCSQLWKRNPKSAGLKAQNSRDEHSALKMN